MTASAMLPATRPWTAQESIGEPPQRLAAREAHSSGIAVGGPVKSTDHKYLQTRWKLWGRVAGLQWIRLEPVGYGRAGEWTSSRGRETGGSRQPRLRCVVDREGVQAQAPCPLGAAGRTSHRDQEPMSGSIDRARLGEGVPRVRGDSATASTSSSGPTGSAAIWPRALIRSDSPPSRVRSWIPTTTGFFRGTWTAGSRPIRSRAAGSIRPARSSTGFARPTRVRSASSSCISTIWRSASGSRSGWNPSRTV